MLELLESPTETAYSLDNIKSYLRVLNTHQDYQINMMAKAYLLKAEEVTNLVLQGITTFKLTLDGGFRDLILPKNPVVEILKVEYIDCEGIKKVFALENIEFSFPFGATKTPFTLTFNGVLPPAKSIIVTFKAGFSSIDSRVEMFLNAKVGEEYDGLEDGERSKYLDGMLDSLRVNYL